MYLRENLKSRPEFGADLMPHKDVIRSFYQQEEETYDILPLYKNYDHKQMAKMTHIEPFRHPVWDTGLWKLVIKEELTADTRYVLFD